MWRAKTLVSEGPLGQACSRTGPTVGRPASTSAIGNLIAGVILTYTRAFDLGDRVKIGETVGDVMERTLLVTRIRTIKNVEITVPNASVLGGHIINYSSVSHDTDLIVHTAVTLGYDAPWPRVHEPLIAAATATPGVRAEPKPFVLQRSLGDFSSIGLKLGVKITKWLALDYVLAARRLPLLIDKWQVTNNLVLSVSYQRSNGK